MMLHHETPTMNRPRFFNISLAAMAGLSYFVAMLIVDPCNSFAISPSSYRAYRYPRYLYYQYGTNLRVLAPRQVVGARHHISQHNGLFAALLDNGDSSLGPNGKIQNHNDASSRANTCANPWQFHVAPMQCYTNAPLRHLFRLLSPDCCLWTEMEKVPDLMAASPEALQQRFGPPGPKDITLQIGGNNADDMEQCVKDICKSGYHFREINLNCGCPSIEAGGASFGASLMKQPQLTRSLLEAIQNGCVTPSQASTTTTEVSLKCRIAVMDTPQDMTASAGVSEQEYELLHHYVSQAELAGISHLVLHARPAILTGLNPTKNRQVPALEYGIVEQIAKDFPSLRVTLNGGIQNLSDLNRLFPGDGEGGDSNDDGTTDRNESMIASHMAGRWMLRRPLDLHLIQDQYFDVRTKNRKKNVESMADISITRAIDKYIEYVDSEILFSSGRNSPKTPLADVCLPLYLLSEQLREDYDLYHDDVNDNDDVTSSFLNEPAAIVPPRTTSSHGPNLNKAQMDGLYDTLKDVVAHIHEFVPNSKKKKLPDDANFKKISTSFKGIVGTKVVNKWKRNRAEI